MFDTGNVVYCKDFQFNNGNDSKDKYFIILKRVEDKIIIGSLPTRKNKIPSFIDVEHGCINKDDHCFNCYLFQANKSICNTGFCFDLPTFIYGDEIDTYPVDIIESNYVEGQTYAIQGKLHDVEYKSIIECILKSNSVKKKIQRALIG